MIAERPPNDLICRRSDFVRCFHSNDVWKTHACLLNCGSINKRNQIPENIAVFGLK
jgi:hypothetical protein